MLIYCHTGHVKNTNTLLGENQCKEPVNGTKMFDLYNAETELLAKTTGMRIAKMYI